MKVSEAERIRTCLLALGQALDAGMQAMQEARAADRAKLDAAIAVIREEAATHRHAAHDDYDEVDSCPVCSFVRKADAR